MKWLDAVIPRSPARQVEDRDFFSFNGHAYGIYGQTTYGKKDADPIADEFVSYVEGALKMDGVISAIEMNRFSLFSEARFQWQALRSGRPGDLFGTADLQLLERPWAGGTTGDLLTRMLLEADMAGNSYWTIADGEIANLRPDWVEIALAERTNRMGQCIGYKRVGYHYYHGGKIRQDQESVFFMADEVCHFAPYPDPAASYRGMSWMTPVIREIQADRLATEHKAKFFENAAPQPLTARVLTPTGWSRMGDMKLGSLVVGRDGKGHHVIGVFPQGEQDIYRVTFSDGAVAECTEDHLWQVANEYDVRRDTSRQMTLRQMVDGGLRYPSGAAKWSVPFVEPVEFDHPVEPTVDPYVFGLLLGDGSFRGNGQGSGGISLSCDAQDANETQDEITPALPDGVTITRRDRGTWSEFYFKGAGGPTPNPMTVAIRELDLIGVRGREKWIPEPYMLASVSDRVALLQGLMDSDGHVGKQGTDVRFSTSSPVLASQVADLVGSLGGSSKTSVRDNDREHPLFDVRLKRLPEWITPFRLSRKVARYAPASRVGRRRMIVSAELVRREQAQCIRVDVEDHLYVTDDYVVTHNTPNLHVSYPDKMKEEHFRKVVELMDEQHKGAANAYKTLYTDSGADVTVLGQNMQQMDFKSVQGAGETRLAAAAGVPAVIVGLSEGMQGSSLNTGNYTAAKRNFADKTMRPLWRNAAGSLEVLFTPPAGSRLWYDDRDVAFLRDDSQDRANIQQTNSISIRNYTDAGFTPESAVAAVLAEDESLLVHSGLYSVQLQAAGAEAPTPTDGNTP